MKPLQNKVIVERIQNQALSSGGIILNRSEEPDRAKVIAIGPDVVDVAVDEVAVVNWNAATKIQDELYIINIDHVILVIED